VSHRIGCIAFTILGLAWLTYFLFDFTASTMGDCDEGSACSFYRAYVSGMVFWRGLAVALLLILAYLAFRFFYKDDDVQ
jgi:hypothetical protein